MIKQRLKAASYLEMMRKYFTFIKFLKYLKTPFFKCFIKLLIFITSKRYSCITADAFLYLVYLLAYLTLLTLKHR